MSNFLRQKYKEKPQAWGSFESVQRSLFLNAEKIGINPTDIALAMPMWNPGSQQDYSKNNIIASVGAAMTFQSNSIKGGSSYASSTNTINCGTILDPRTWNGITIIIDGYFKEPTFGYPGIISNAIYGNTYGNFLVAYEYYSDRQEILFKPGNSSGVRTGDIPALNDCVLTTMFTKTQYAKIYKNQNLLASALCNVQWGSVNNTTYINGYYRSTESKWRTGANIYKTIYIFNHEINFQQQSLLADNPYQLWQRQPDVYFSIAASGEPQQTYLNTAWQIRLLDSQQTSWNILNQLNSNSSWKLITNAVSNTSYKILTDINENIAYKILSATDNQSSYKILNSINSESEWHILNKAETDTSWNIFTKLSQETAWQIILSGLIEQALSWKVLNTETLETAFNLLKQNNSITAWKLLNVENQTAAWNILNTKEQPLSHNILNNSSTDTAWKVINITDSALSWSILKNLTQNSAWQILNKETLQTSWALLSDILPSALYNLTAHERNFIINPKQRIFIIIKEKKH